MMKLNKQLTTIALLTITTLAGTTLQVNSATARGIRVSPGVVRGFKQGASIGHKAGEVVNKGCEIQKQKNSNTNNLLCKN